MPQLAIVVSPAGSKTARGSIRPNFEATLTHRAGRVDLHFAYSKNLMKRLAPDIDSGTLRRIQHSFGRKGRSVRLAMERRRQNIDAKSAAALHNGARNHLPVAVSKILFKLALEKTKGWRVCEFANRDRRADCLRVTILPGSAAPILLAAYDTTNRTPSAP